MVAELFQFHCIHCASVATAISSASVQVGPSAFVLSSTYTAAVFALAFKHQSSMKSTTWLLFSCLFLAGLSKAKALPLKRDLLEEMNLHLLKIGQASA